MLTVRFPNGQAVQYNTAQYVKRSANGYCDLYTKKDGVWIAQVPVGCIIENVRACSVYDATHKAFAEEMLRELAGIRRKVEKLIRESNKEKTK